MGGGLAAQQPLLTLGSCRPLMMLYAVFRVVCESDLSCEDWGPHERGRNDHVNTTNDSTSVRASVGRAKSTSLDIHDRPCPPATTRKHAAARRIARRRKAGMWPKSTANPVCGRTHPRYLSRGWRSSSPVFARHNVEPLAHVPPRFVRWRPRRHPCLRVRLLRTVLGHVLGGSTKPQLVVRTVCSLAVKTGVRPAP